MSNSPTGNGTAGVTQRCVSLAQGTLNPDSRVNYEFGLVLGVDDFRQEQLYHLEKEYMHNRSLHGYGTVAGLNVTLAAEGDDVQVNVAPGVGIDQAGRAFVVRYAQCAYLRPWLRRQAQNDDPDIAGPATTPGLHRLYVVATYDECLDALVTIAGQPCATSEQAVAPSRIRDAFQIELRWAPPAMPAWDAIRCLADVMGDVRFAPELTDEDSDEAEIIERVRLVGSCDEVQARRDAWIEAGNAPNLYLPEATGRAALDRIFTVWVTEVRPALLPDVLDPLQPDVETGVLLATIDIEIGEDTTAAEPVFELAAPDASDEGRPYLLQTQLIQELVTLGAGGETLPQRTFATLLVQDSARVLAWLHHPNPVLLPESLGAAVRMWVNEVEVEGNIAAIAGAFNTFQITSAQSIEPGARVVVSFSLSEIQTGATDETDDIDDTDETAEPAPGNGPAPGEVPVRPGTGVITRPDVGDVITRPDLGEVINRPGTGIVGGVFRPQAVGDEMSLLASMAAQGFDYIGRDGDRISVYTIAPELPEVRPLVTVSTVVTEARTELALWFHAGAPLNVPADAVQLERVNVTPPTFAFSMVSDSDFAESWVLRPTRAQLTDATQVILRFNTDQIRVQDADGNAISLTQHIRQNQIAFLGYDGENSIVVPYVVDVPQTGGGPAPGMSEEDVRRILMGIPTRPFVTITPTGMDGQLGIFELWFHLDHAGDIFQSEMQEPNFRVYAEGQVRNRPRLIRAQLEALQRTALNRFTARVVTEGTLPIWCRFVFPLDEGNNFRNAEAEYGSIREYMERTGIKLDGHFILEEETGQECLIVFVRIPRSITGGQE